MTTKSTSPTELREPAGIQAFLSQYPTIPLVSLTEALQPLLLVVPDLNLMISTVKHFRYTSLHTLTNDESIAILLYSIEWKPRETSFHVILNSTIYIANEQELKPWFLYLCLLKTALDKIPAESSRMTVHHAVRLNLAAQYPTGKRFVWWSLTRCTPSLDNFNKEKILGQTGARTLFLIDCFSGKNIRQHSFYREEDEIILPFACQLQVTSCFDAGNGLHIVRLQEIEPISAIPKLLEILPNISSKPKVKFADKLPTKASVMKQSLNQRDSVQSNETSIKSINPKIQKAIDSLDSDPVKTTLDLSRRQLGDQDVKDLVDALRDNQTVTTLNLENNRIGDLGAQYLANLLRHNKTLKSLSVRNNPIRPPGVQQLAQALQSNTTLTTLNLRANMIGNTGAQYLADALQHNQTLTSVDLASNRIGPQGARYLAQSLHDNTTLTRLDLGGNTISQQGGEHLANALQKNRTLLELNLESNQINAEAKRRIGRIVKTNLGVNVFL